MSEEIVGKMRGASTGFHGGAIFRLTNGQVWQQKVYKYRYRYRYRPDVRIFTEKGGYVIHIEGMDETVSVVKVAIVEEGVIVSDFKGFDQDARFEFQNGSVWVPAEYKYAYHYAHRPEAIIINGIDGMQMSVEGMSETIRVRRA